MHLIQYSEDFTPEIISLARENGFDGIIATFPCSVDALEALAATPIPTVLVNVQSPLLSKRTAPTTTILNDNKAIGRKAAAMFLKNGNYSSFACVSKSADSWYLERCEGFKNTLTLNGKSCTQLTLQSLPKDGDIKNRSLESFLLELPKPTAVYASSDECAIKILEAANAIKASIPEQIAVIGTDNDEFLVCHSSPPVSSIIPGHTTMGTRAAIEIKKLITGEKSPDENIFIAPVGIAERPSSKPTLPATTMVRNIKKFIENNKKLYPDFYKDDFIIDAKYKHLEKGVGREDLYQIVTYMYCKKAERGAFIYPCKEENIKSLKLELSGYGKIISVLPFYIPQSIECYEQFKNKIFASEDNILLKVKMPIT